jgi:arginyl-tRNA synthetase
MKDKVAALLTEALDRLIDDGLLDASQKKPVHVENTKDPSHGDLATNVAMMHAKAAGMSPRALAERIVDALPASTDIASTDIAGPGFINLTLAQDAAFAPVLHCLDSAEAFGVHEATGESWQVEYVSANPTGPLHVGHGRGAAYGATLVNLLTARGHRVEAEYYVNDAGRQMNILAVSVYLRYLEILGEPVVFPRAGYQGDYIEALGRALQSEMGTALHRQFAAISHGLPADDEAHQDAHIDALIQTVKDTLGDAWTRPFQLALDSILDDIHNDLGQFGAVFDQWFSEYSLVDSGAIASAIETLERGGHLYTANGALWFRSTEFGDDKDRVVRRENGETTYFASDIAYIANKFARGFDRIVYVWGADHHGYIIRIKAAAQALGYDPERLIIRLVQFANLYRDGERLQMSTRSGSFVTLRSLREEVGRDACRYFYVMRKADQHLDFDLSLATSETKDNPVYYIQYAHARICRVFESLTETPYEVDRGRNHLTALSQQDELDLATAIGRFPETVQKAADTLEAHVLCYYLQELAADFHRWYNGTRLLVDDLNLRDARLTLAQAVRTVLANGLTLLGVSAPKSM